MTRDLRPRTLLARVLATLLGGIASIAAVTDASASVNVERRRRLLASKPFMLDMQGKLGFRQGNVNLLDFGFKSLLGLRRGRHTILLFNESSFTAVALAARGRTVADLRENDTRVTNRHMGHVRYGYRVFDWLTPEALTQLQTDEFLLTRTRLLLGAGPRFRLHQNERFAAFLGTVYLAEYEELDERVFIVQPDSTRPDNWWHRFSAVVALDFAVTKRLSMQTATYLQPRFDRPSDFIVLNDNELVVTITDHLDLKLVTTIRYDSAPPTYCGTRLGPTGCAPADVRRLQGTDVTLENALAVRF